MLYICPNRNPDRTHSDFCRRLFSCGSGCTRSRVEGGGGLVFSLGLYGILLRTAAGSSSVLHDVASPHSAHGPRFLGRALGWSSEGEGLEPVARWCAESHANPWHRQQEDALREGAHIHRKLKPHYLRPWTPSSNLGHWESKACTLASIRTS